MLNPVSLSFCRLLARISHLLLSRRRRVWIQGASPRERNAADTCGSAAAVEGLVEMRANRLQQVKMGRPGRGRVQKRGE
jgi:hypothetical protein